MGVIFSRQDGGSLWMPSEEPVEQEEDMVTEEASIQPEVAGLVLMTHSKVRAISQYQTLNPMCRLP